MEEKEYIKYKDKIIDISEDLSDLDIKINPDFYIHTALLKAQQSLQKDNVKEGFLQYRIFIEHIETLCQAAGILTNDYESNIEKFKQSHEYKNTEDKLVQSVKLSNQKLKLMMIEVFSKKTWVG